MFPLALGALLALGSLAAPPAAAKDDPLAPARALLDAGDFMNVQDAVDRAGSAPASDVAEVLTRAGKLAFEQGDRWMADRYCAKALGRTPNSRPALDLCAHAALTDERFDDAERYGARLGKLSPGDAEVAFLRASVAVAGGHPASVKSLLAPFARGPHQQRVAEQLGRADEAAKRLKEEGAHRKELDARLAAAVAAEARSGLPAWSGDSSEVVLYTTDWCRYCKQAKAWFRQQRLAFVERDVEKDPEAGKELARKCAKARVHTTGIPVLDARGRLIVGFSAESYQHALR